MAIYVTAHLSTLNENHRWAVVESLDVDLALVDSRADPRGE
jgi:hypothetical protein